MAKLREGSTIGKWTLVEILGEGGNGVVWRCRDTAGAENAIKVLKSYLLEPTGIETELAKRRRKVHRFLDEIQFLTDAPPKGVLPALDSYSPAQPSKSDFPWVVIPLGISMPKYVETNEPTFAELVGYFRDVAATLARLHSLASSHRDIKPDNILLVDGIATLSDFGLVHFEGKDAITDTSEVLGPVYFVAPEMMHDASTVDARPADVFSLAKSFWVMTTRRRFPLPGHQRLGEAALGLSVYVADERAHLLESMLDRCTRHEPNERPAAAEVHRELQAWLEGPRPAGDAAAELSDVVGTLAQTFAQSRSLRTRRATRQEAAERHLQNATRGLEALKRALDRGGLPVQIHAGSPGAALRRFGYDPQSLGGVWTNSVEVRLHLNQANARSLFQTFSIALLLFENGVFRVHAGSWCTERDGRNETVSDDLLDPKEMDVEGAVAESAIAEAVTALLQAAPDVMSRFNEKCKSAVQDFKLRIEGS